MSEFSSTTATILNGQSQSSVVELRAYKTIGLILPATFTGTTVTFLVCNTATGTFDPLYTDAGTEVSVTVAQGHAVGIATASLALAPFAYMIVRSGTGGSPVTQAQDSAVTVCFK